MMFPLLLSSALSGALSHDDVALLVDNIEQMEKAIFSYDPNPRDIQKGKLYTIQARLPDDV
jgi:hypothetical protein